ncbi:NAD(P)H-dependent FMN reductase [Methylobacillus rhizosphaerae]|uniref:NAD(P)H-dependent FMN reductase n=1 Tax=Methylobacillus rhizosphaerae TaxID=551994 RepID=A0A238XS03_9PROT|nr:NAD(P)H-dependent oxidoreductase [Methylobacillus rhizosphaerae]SNR61291.1 NAD(P)H-dependent FMN reductase [Methylobacillus rhizosphaerae]
MIKLLGISGSLRQQSLNTALLHAMQERATSGVQIEVATLHGIPLYDGDLEAASGIPDAVSTLKQKIIASHGVILASPEYNGSVPGVLKNAIDWLSRPPADIAQVFNDRAFTVIGATPSGFGTILAQDAWLTVLRQLGTRYWTGGKLLLSRAHDAFDDKGKLINDRSKEDVQKFIQGFAQFAEH